MVQETVLRLKGIEGLQAPIAICNEDHRFMMAEQLCRIDIHPECIILEPIGKNTAPAVTMAALAAKDPEDILLVLPADHVIGNVAAFQAAVIKAGVSCYFWYCANGGRNRIWIYQAILRKYSRGF
jgi:mannose-1-phosphate guanylyltransferase/mannose-1-phosphate guanylyltransferase/mannose-6-phosphate isomerase